MTESCIILYIYDIMYSSASGIVYYTRICNDIVSVVYIVSTITAHVQRNYRFVDSTIKLSLCLLCDSKTNCCSCWQMAGLREGERGVGGTGRIT